MIPEPVATREKDIRKKCLFWRTVVQERIEGQQGSSEDGGNMEREITSDPRRSRRIFHRVRVQALGTGLEGRKFREICETVMVSAHGGLLYLNHGVENGGLLVLVNPETQEELECRIVYLGEAGEKGQRVGVEFLTPAPHFWGLEFEKRDRTPGSVN